MARQVELWECVDGFRAQSEAEALAYELRRDIILLGKEANDAQAVDSATGTVDVEVVSVLALKLSTLMDKRIAVVAAVEVGRLSKMEGSP